MSSDNNSLQTLTAKEEIRDLVLLYSRAADRGDLALMRSLYTKDGTDSHVGIILAALAGESVDPTADHSGTADELVAALKQVEGRAGYMGHHVCNHLISIDSSDEAHGEVYSIAYQVVIGEDDTASELVMMVRYLDRYQKEDGHWRFARRDIMFDYQTVRPVPMPEPSSPSDDPSYALLPSRVFQRGPRS